MEAKRKPEEEFIEQELRQDEALQREETVRVKLPLTDPADPQLEVGVNGVIKTIRRGVSVELPMSIVEALEHGGAL